MMDINKILGKKKGSNPFDTTLSKTIGSNPVSSMLKNNFNFKKFGGKNDWDGDGVHNRKDCQPRNVMRQDITFKNMDNSKNKYPRIVYEDGYFNVYKNSNDIMGVGDVVLSKNDVLKLARTGRYWFENIGRQGTSVQSFGVVPPNQAYGAISSISQEDIKFDRGDY